MSMVVQHNLTAMNSNRMLGVTTSSQAKSTEKLSSGYKINRAADDAAGLAISEKMRKQIRGLTQASTNAQDGISAVQTAEGALAEVQDMLQRMNELAVKSANGTNSASDRDSIQSEIDQLTTEIDRVSETTKFNETYLLKGDINNDKDTDFKYKEIKVTNQDLYYLDTAGAVKTFAKGSNKSQVQDGVDYYSDSNVHIKGGEKADFANADSVYTETKDVISVSTLYTKDASGNYVSVEKGAEYNAGSTYYKASAAAGGTKYVDSDMEVETDHSALTSNGNVLVAGKDLYDSTGTKVTAGAAVDTTKAYYKSSGTAGLRAAAKVDMTNDSAYGATGKSQFVDKDGNEIAENGLYKYLKNDGTLKADSGLMIRVSDGPTGLRAATQDDVDDMVDASKQYDVGSLDINLHVGADATKNNQIEMKIKSMSAAGLGVKDLKVDGEDDTNALNAIETIKAALERVSSQRSDLGAIQNRLEHTIKNLDNVVENTTSAESQIRDTDMASEMVTYSKNNILAQAGQSMLAQANQSNQGVLSLLG